MQPRSHLLIPMQCINSLLPLLNFVLLSRLASKGASLSITPTPKRQKLDHNKKVDKHKAWQGCSEKKTISWHASHPPKDLKRTKRLSLHQSLIDTEQSPLTHFMPYPGWNPSTFSTYFLIHWGLLRNCPAVELEMSGVPDQLILDTGQLFEAVS